MDLLEIYGKNLKKIRLEKGISQEKLADTINLHRTYISFLERGLRNPTLKTIELIAKSLDTEVELFLKK